MEITWLGHSCFRIKGSRTTVITDPYSSDLGYSLGKQTADIVTVSHQHPGHSNTRAINGSPKIFSRAGEYEISGVLLLGEPTFHDAEEGKKRGKNTVFLIHIDDVSICHLGDLGHVLNSKQVEDLDNINILMIPVGGVSTIAAAQAAQVVRLLEPKIVIPMHYKTPALKRELESADAFLKEMAVKDLSAQTKLMVTRGKSSVDYAGERPQLRPGHVLPLFWLSVTLFSSVAVCLLKAVAERFFPVEG